MSTDITVKAQEAMRLKNDTAFTQFIRDVREQQKEVFATSGAKDIEAREEAHAIIRALEAIEIHLDAAIGAERFLKERN
tara:strand:- start:935 stop:1171 length:237 start_codon:yes stop_codon:yes gene_type:complete